MNEQALLDILDRLRNRFFGKYRGTVTEVDAATLRIKAKVPAVLAGQATGWCMPCVPYAGKGVGLAFLPEVGAGVWIEFEGGDVSYPIWVGCYWRDGELPSDTTPTVKGIVTKSGQQSLRLLLDTDAGQITLADDVNQNKVTLDGDGVTLTRGSGTVAVSDSGVSVNDGALEVS
jgi:uncharacterized protein involved in type VI secretion and phage assembly